MRWTFLIFIEIPNLYCLIVFVYVYCAEHNSWATEPEPEPESSKRPIESAAENASDEKRAKPDTEAPPPTSAEDLAALLAAKKKALLASLGL